MGSAYSEELVKGMAEAGRGTCEAIRESADTGKKVIKTLRLAMSPCYLGTRMELGAWGEGADVQTFPNNMRPIFPQDRSCFYAVKKPLGEQVKDFTINIV